ncbi:MAG: hypothetical protein AMJ65_14780 [Phycisphaerae bacterium SG8_4]|nr:MAG: hypothetical protein AMJ65_14780 [Phycisphaerae bacterium SG8_4]
MSRFLTISALALALFYGGIACAKRDDTPWQEDLDAFLEVLHAEHDNPYFHTPRAEFEQAIAEYRAALPELSRAERITGFARLVAMVGDGHTWMPMHRLPFDGLPPGPGFSSLPIRFELFDDGLYVVGASRAHAGLLGARVTGFGDVPAKTAIARVMELLPQDATNFAREFVAEWLMQVELLTALGLASDGHVALSLQRGGESLTADLTALDEAAAYNWIFSTDGGPMGQQDWQIAAERQPFWMQAFDGHIRIAELEGATYLQFTEIRDGVDQTFAELAQAAVRQAEATGEPALIIDLRRCLGGDGTLNEGLVHALAQSESLNRDGRLIVLTGRSTHSAAVMLVSALEQRTAARFIGQATADRPNHYGETNIFVTPNSALPIIHASEYYQTSTPDDQRRFRTPDIAISYTFADYEAGTDAVLETALHLINGD